MGFPASSSSLHQKFKINGNSIVGNRYNIVCVASIIVKHFQKHFFTSDSFLRKAFMRVVQNSHIVGDWKFLARQLGHSEADLGEIEEECTGLRDRCLRSMVRWRNTIGKEATVELLAKHLKKCRYTSVAGNFQINHADHLTWKRKIAWKRIEIA